MLFDKDEDHNHKNCTFNYFKLYILFLTKYCTNTDKKFPKNSFTKKDKKVTTNYAH